MSLTLKRLATAAISDTASAIYTPTETAGRIDAVLLTNSSGAAVTVSLWLPGAGASPGSQNIALTAYSVAAGASVPIGQIRGQVVEGGASLYAQASVAGVVTLIASGVEQG